VPSSGLLGATRHAHSGSRQAGWTLLCCHRIAQPCTAL